MTSIVLVLVIIFTFVLPVAILLFIAYEWDKERAEQQQVKQDRAVGKTRSRQLSKSDRGGKTNTNLS